MGYIPENDIESERMQGHRSEIELAIQQSRAIRATHQQFTERFAPIMRELSFLQSWDLFMPSLSPTQFRAKNQRLKRAIEAISAECRTAMDELVNGGPTG